MLCSRAVSSQVVWSQTCRKVCTLLSGADMARQIQEKVKLGVLDRVGQEYHPPRLTAIAVGSVPASSIYLAKKREVAEFCGIDFSQIELDDDVREEYLVEIVRDVNRDPNVDGVIVQLPLPDHIDEARVCNTVMPDKDVDGFTRTNLGLLLQRVGEGFVPCTALAVRKIVESVLSPGNLSAVIIGRSHNVGLPIQIILGADKAKGGLDLTTSLCHRNTPRKLLTNLVRQADLVVSAAGVPGIVNREMVKPGAVLVDVGLNRLEEDGRNIVTGDFCRSVREVASVVTPVPGGVGPCTVAFLMYNTLLAANRRSSYVK